MIEPKAAIISTINLHLPRSQVLHNTRIKIESDITFQVISKFANGH